MWQAPRQPWVKMAGFDRSRAAGGVSGELGQGPPPRRLFVKSYGCQMNVYDGQRMADVLAPEGYAGTALLEEADLVILNTCHIRERATEKVFSELGKLRALKAARAAARAGDQDYCRGLRRASRRRRNFPASKSGGYRRRAAKLSPLARAFAPRQNLPRGPRHGFSRRKQVRSSRRAFAAPNSQARGQRFRDRAGRLR